MMPSNVLATPAKDSSPQVINWVFHIIYLPIWHGHKLSRRRRNEDRYLRLWVAVASVWAETSTRIAR